MSAIEKSFFFRRLVYSSPLFIIAGIVWMFFDPEYAVIPLGVGIVGLIVGGIILFRAKGKAVREDRKTSTKQIISSAFQEYSDQQSEYKQKSQPTPKLIQSNNEFQVMYCSSCGKKVDSSEYFCDDCAQQILE